MALRRNDPRHGTQNGYSNLGCRCDRCREAWRIYKTEQNHRVGRHRPREVYLAEVRATPPPHGTESRYSHQGCRCTECRAAAAAAKARRRARSRELGLNTNL